MIDTAMLDLLAVILGHSDKPLRRCGRLLREAIELGLVVRKEHSGSIWVTKRGREWYANPLR